MNTLQVAIATNDPVKALNPPADRVGRQGRPFEPMPGLTMAIGKAQDAPAIVTRGRMVPPVPDSRRPDHEPPVFDAPLCVELEREKRVRS